MELIFVRHAIAEEREEFLKKKLEDHLRPVTVKGRKKMEKVAMMLSDKIGKVDIIVTSPYVRARETAEILSSFFFNPQIIDAAELVPQSPPQSFVKWLRTYKGDFDRMMIVGHEPHLGMLATFLLTGEAKNLIEFKKSSMACFELTHQQDLAPGQVTLKWLIQPKMIC